MTDYHSGWKRGKGARRIPWRDGGARPWPRRSRWRKQTMHAVRRVDLNSPVVVEYHSKPGKLE